MALLAFPSGIPTPTSYQILCICLYSAVCIELSINVPRVRIWWPALKRICVWRNLWLTCKGKSLPWKNAGLTHLAGPRVHRNSHWQLGNCQQIRGRSPHMKRRRHMEITAFYLWVMGGRGCLPLGPICSELFLLWTEAPGTFTYPSFHAAYWSLFHMNEKRLWFWILTSVLCNT